MSTGITRGGGAGSTGASRGTSTGGGPVRPDGDIDLTVDAALTAIDDARQSLAAVRALLEARGSIPREQAQRCEQVCLLAEQIASELADEAA